MNHLYVVGIGPGDTGKLTIEAKEVLSSCEVIVGYTVYVDLLKEYFPQKEYIVTGMTKEEMRCRMALESAEKGKKTAVVCSGDAGVYGMAGILIELSVEYPGVEIEVIAGVTAALSGGAVLGAPIGHDFAVVSLSDRLTPWEQIEKRLRCAAQGDFILCLYNPSSKKRKDYLKKACEILLEYQPAETVCGYVRNIGRDGEACRILSLAELKDIETDMFTTVFIGNTKTKQIGAWMVTPRGYRLKQTEEDTGR